MVKELPESKMAAKFAEGIKNGKVGLSHASGVLLRDEGKEDGLLLPQDPGELLTHANPMRVLQYSSIGLNSLYWSTAIAAYVEAGGDLSADQTSMYADLKSRIPQFFEGKSKVTGQSENPMSIVQMVLRLRSGKE